MQFHEKLFYHHQTKARNLLTEPDLKETFESRINEYDQQIGKYLPYSADAAILDLPCGFGNMLYYLRHHGYRNIQGYDLDKAQVDLARKLDLPAEQGDVFNILSVRQKIYQAIFSVDFVEHLEKDDACRFLQLCKNALQTEGRLLLRVPCADSPFGAGHAWNDITHRWYLTPTAWKTTLGMLGFDKPIFRDLRAEPYAWWPRIKYKIANRVAAWFLDSMRIAAPRIWSRSMWVITSPAKT